MKTSVQPKAKLSSSEITRLRETAQHAAGTAIYGRIAMGLGLVTVGGGAVISGLCSKDGMKLGVGATLLAAGSFLLWRHAAPIGSPNGSASLARAVEKHVKAELAEELKQMPHLTPNSPQYKQNNAPLPPRFVDLRL